jgi:hypothetical protein
VDLRKQTFETPSYNCTRDTVMKTNHLQKIKKILIVIISPIILIVLLFIIFNSSIFKYIVGKYDEKLTGRKITIDWAHVNPLTGNILFSNLKIYELNSDSIFFSAENAGLKISILKLFFRTFEISRLTLNHPKGVIIQNRKNLNINDLAEKFSSGKNSATSSAKVHINILNISINEGEFHYHEKQIPINYYIRKVNIESKGKRWDSDTIATQISFLPGTGTGSIKGDFTVNLRNKDYRLAMVADKFNLNIIEQYLNDLTNYGSFSANIDANIKSKGNLQNSEAVTTSGLLAINDLHFGKNPEDDYVSFDKLVLAIRQISPKNKIYMYDSITLNRPYIKFERYDNLDNVQTIFGKNITNITTIKSDPSRFNLVLEIANYIKVMSKNFLKSDYKIDQLRIYNANFKFNDFSTSEKFALELNPLTIIADSIDKNHDRVDVTLKSVFKPYGNLSVALSINPKDSSDFDLQYKFEKLPVSMFNPYIISATSFSLDKGTLDFKGAWNVRNGLIKSTNHLVIIDPRLTKRIRNKDTKWIPAPLIMAFIRERGNVIDYEIPITGNLKDPDFHLSDIIFDMLENIFIKPPSTQYIMEVKNIETEIENTLTLKWMMRQNTILPVQEKFIAKMADFLIKNQDASITFNPYQYAIKEKEHILFYEAKKKYFLVINNKNSSSFNAEDSAAVNNMSVKDSLFVIYLNRQIKDSLLFTIQEKCAVIIDSSLVNTKFNQLIKERETAVNSYFKKREVDKRIIISKNENVIPYNGFSHYKIDYPGDIPESLIKAYQEMNELNNEAPRKKYKQERKKNEKML